MARACLKLYIDEKCIRIYGGNKSIITKEVARIKSLSPDEVRKEFRLENSNSTFRYSIIKVKRKHKVYRLPELQDDMTEEEFEKVIPNLGVLQSLMVNSKYASVKLNKELEFNSEGKLINKSQYDKMDLMCSYVKISNVKKFGKYAIVKEIMKAYAEAKDAGV